MAGYKGYSMSNNAVQAYSDGEKPFTKWTKKDLLEGIKEGLKEIEKNISIDLFKKLGVEYLRACFLYKSSWHHTSKFYNKTDFYSISLNALDNITEEKIYNLLELQNKEKKEKENKKNYQYGIISIQVWGGTRKYPKRLEDETVIGIVVNDWLYYNEYGDRINKYNIYGNKINSINTYPTYSKFVKANKEYKNTKKYFNKIVKLKNL